MNYADFSEDERKFYLQEAGFDSREEKSFISFMDVDLINALMSRNCQIEVDAFSLSH